MNEKDYKEMREDIKRIKTAVCGDKEAGIEGLVNRVDRHEKTLVVLQRVGYGVAGVFTFISSWLGISKIFEK